MTLGEISVNNLVMVGFLYIHAVWLDVTSPKILYPRVTTQHLALDDVLYPWGLDPLIRRAAIVGCAPHAGVRVV